MDGLRLLGALFVMTGATIAVTMVVQRATNRSGVLGLLAFLGGLGFVIVTVFGYGELVT